MAFCRLTYVPSAFALKKQPCSYGSHVTQCSALLQLHSRVQSAGCMLLRLGADPTLWLTISLCPFSDSVRPRTELM